MTNKPICPGTGRAIPIPGNEKMDDRRFANCERCGTRLELVRGCIPKHRLRAKPRDSAMTCMVPGCDKPRLGVCAEHHDEAVS